jgi:hypothetical protein
MLKKFSIVDYMPLLWLNIHFLFGHIVPCEKWILYDEKRRDKKHGKY